VAAAFGSERALEIMDADGDSDYQGYEERMAGLRSELGGLPPEQRSENLYWGWLHSLRPLLGAKGQDYPAFMQTAAWADKDLQSFLGSWTELRHDTILYAKQSMTIEATALQPDLELPRGYVEPQPEVYDRLAFLGRDTVDGLGAYGVLSGEIRGKLDQMNRLLETLRDISLRELAGEPLPEEDYALIRSIGQRLESLTTFSKTTGDELSSEADERMDVVADVHTDTNSKQVLEEAVGGAFRIYVLAPVAGGTTATVGGVFSYYEFKHPMADRLTDESWQTMEPRPPQPAWTASFIVE
jgi:hypothetical protein